MGQSVGAVCDRIVRHSGYFSFENGGHQFGVVEFLASRLTIFVA
jgi:hypothetical protein